MSKGHPYNLVMYMFYILMVYFQVDDAMQVFNKCRRKGHKFKISTFNAILHGLAAKKRVLDFQVFYHNMAAEHVTPNVQTYAAVLELHGQLNDVNVIKDTCVKINNQVDKPIKYLQITHVHNKIIDSLRTILDKIVHYYYYY